MLGALVVMRLFGRKSEPADPVTLIADFWTWWDDARAQVDALVDADDTAELDELLGSAVAEMNPALVWEITEGLDAERAIAWRARIRLPCASVSGWSSRTHGRIIRRFLARVA